MSPPSPSWRDDCVIAAAFLTRLPVWRWVEVPSGDLHRAMRAFPLVGLLVGAIGAAAYRVATALGVPVPAAALLAVLATVLATGALHEDGLADTADGFGGGRDREAKLAIMRDSRTGAFGALALIFSIGLRAAALAAIARPNAVAEALIAAHAGSRALLPALMNATATARSDGLGATAGRPDESTVLWALALGLIVTVVALGFASGIIAAVVTALAVAGLGRLAWRQIGGYTGDVLGAAQQVGEITMLLAAAATVAA
jgi:adenosylcobinamide-GDP ribazoletransferase